MGYNCTQSATCQANLPGLSLAEMCGASTFVLFMSILDKLVRSNEKISGACERVKSIEAPDEKYDFIVTGGGGAGAVVASRLSENPDWKILLLEAGPDEPPGGEIPLFVGSLPGTIVDWNFTTPNECNACLSNNGTCPLASGRMLGGSTSHNWMIYLRGNPTDYDNWARQGNDGWNWEDVKPFYLAMEDNGEIERVGRFDHSTGGPVSINRFPYLPPIKDSIFAAFEEAGFNISNDLNGAQMTGFAEVQTTSKNGVRVSSASAYLRPVRNRENLHISLDSLVTRVIIEDHKAVGVEYHKNGELKKVRASREVIVSAGAVKSPQILMLSGIGPKEHLESFGIDPINDLPGVGENFHNHLGHYLSFTINEKDNYITDYKTAAQYLINQTGPLSGCGLNPLQAIVNSNCASPDHPDIYFFMGGYDQGCAPGQVGALRSSGRRNVSILVVNLQPKSRGRISLASNDPLQDPKIWGNYLGDSSDVDIIVSGIKMALPLVETKALRALDFTWSSPPLAACSDHKFLSDEYWACAVRQETTPENHVAGSCKMGPSSDPLSVVDSQLRVHGIEGLRVADNSIMPQVISGNTAAPAMMIGERAADFIKKDWALKLG